MLTSNLPELIKPIKLTRQGLLLKGVLPLNRMERLIAAAIEDDGVVEVDLAFSRDRQDFSIVQGTVKTCVKLQCQRCLESVDTDLEVDLSLAFVTKEAKLKQVPSLYEAVLLESEEISLSEMLEDELILMLPITAFHNHCEAYQYRTEEELEAEKVVEEKKDSPFDILKQLKSDSKK